MGHFYIHVVLFVANRASQLVVKLILKLCNVFWRLSVVSELNARVFQIAHNRGLARCQRMGRDNVTDILLVAGFLSSHVLNIWHLEVGLAHLAFALSHVIHFGSHVFRGNAVLNQVLTSETHVVRLLVAEMEMRRLQVLFLKFLVLSFLDFRKFEFFVKASFELLAGYFVHACESRVAVHLWASVVLQSQAAFKRLRGTQHVVLKLGLFKQVDRGIGHDFTFLNFG